MMSLLRQCAFLAIICCTIQLEARMISLPTPFSEEVTKLTSASSTFSHMLYQELTANQPNAIFSPFSAHACLSMALMGARGSTAQDMTTALQLSESSSVHPSYRDLIEDFMSVDQVKLLTSHAMYLNPEHTIVKDYKDKVVSFYHAKVENIDMSAPGGPENPINAWVAQTTENKISQLLHPGVITSDTAMLLLSTIYFKGAWISPFTPALTLTSSFHKPDGSSVQVPLMHQTESFPLKVQAVPGVDVISLPFRDSRFSLIIALPNSLDGLSGLESIIAENPENIDVLFEGLENHYVDLFLPKFKLTATMDLKSALINLGMTSAFLDGADFSGISPIPLKISDVVQKAVIEVTEEGTEAAAATGVHVSVTSGFIGEPFVFKVDHPFLYFLRDESSGQILFHGKLEDPEITEFQV